MFDLSLPTSNRANPAIFSHSSLQIMTRLFSTTKNSLNVQWKTSFNRYIDQAELRSKCHCLSAPCIDIGFRLDKYYWNQQTGSVRFEDGSDRAIIDVKIPCNSDLCFPKEDVVLELREPRCKLFRNFEILIII